MSIRSTIFVEEEYYHIYNRGNSKQVIFHDVQDYEHFINLLRILNTESRMRLKRVRSESLREEDVVSIGAYCLMSNHFHILVTQKKEHGITTFMQKVSTAYVMYYNKKYKRTGGLFEGKFKSKYVEGDTYMKYLFSYIHLNPLKTLDKNWKVQAKYPSKDMLNFLLNYRYSSFGEYYTNVFSLVHKQDFPDYFPTKSLLVKDIISWFDSSL